MILRFFLSKHLHEPPHRRRAYGESLVLAFSVTLASAFHFIFCERSRTKATHSNHHILIGYFCCPRMLPSTLFTPNQSRAASPNNLLNSLYSCFSCRFSRRRPACIIKYASINNPIWPRHALTNGNRSAWSERAESLVPFRAYRFHKQPTIIRFIKHFGIKSTTTTAIKRAVSSTKLGPAERAKMRIIARRHNLAILIRLWWELLVRSAELMLS